MNNSELADKCQKCREIVRDVAIEAAERARANTRAGVEK